MVTIDSYEPVQCPARGAGLARSQRAEQLVDRCGLPTVEEEIELDMLLVVAKPGVQQRIQRRIDGCGQNGPGVALPAMMHRRLGAQAERCGPRLRLLEPLPGFAVPIRQHRIQGLETTLAPGPVVVPGETIRRQQKLQRRILALLHHELLNGGLYFSGAYVHRIDAATHGDELPVS